MSLQRFIPPSLGTSFKVRWISLWCYLPPCICYRQTLNLCLERTPSFYMANARGGTSTTHPLGGECWEDWAKTPRKLDMLCFKHKNYAGVKGLVTENKRAGKIFAVPLLDHLLKPINSFENGGDSKKLSKILSLSLVILFEILLKVIKIIQTAGHQESRALLFIDRFVICFFRLKSLRHERRQYSSSCSCLQGILFLLRIQLKYFCWFLRGQISHPLSSL